VRKTARVIWNLEVLCCFKSYFKMISVLLCFRQVKRLAWLIAGCWVYQKYIFSPTPLNTQCKCSSSERLLLEVSCKITLTSYLRTYISSISFLSITLKTFVLCENKPLKRIEQHIDGHIYYGICCIHISQSRSALILIWNNFN